jgi:hypothetical protein
MPAKLERCVAKTKKSLKKAHPDWSDEKISQVAWASCVKSTGQKPHKKEDTHMPNTLGNNLINDAAKSSYIENIKFKYFVECDFGEEEVFNEKTSKKILDELKKVKGLNLEEEMPIFGRAINETTTKNFHIYLGEELEPATKSLKQSHIITDHRLDTEHTVGMVKESWWDKAARAIRFIGGVDKLDPVTRKIKLKYIDGVSVGGHVKEIICSLCNEKMTWDHEHWLGEKYEGKVAKGIMRGIIFEELTLTPKPADRKATFNFAQSIQESVYDSYMTSFKEYQSIGHNDHSAEEKCSCNQLINETTIKRMEFSEMSAEPTKEELRKAYEKELKMKETIEELQAKVEKSKRLEEQLNKIKAKERDRMEEEVLDLEIQTGKTKESERKLRKLDLSEMSDDMLEARREVLKEWAKEKKVEDSAIITSNSKSLATESTSQSTNNLAGIPKEKLEEEAKKRRLQELIFGESKVSEKGQKVLIDFNNDSGRWRTKI